MKTLLTIFLVTILMTTANALTLRMSDVNKSKKEIETTIRPLLAELSPGRPVGPQPEDRLKGLILGKIGNANGQKDKQLGGVISQIGQDLNRRSQQNMYADSRALNTSLNQVVTNLDNFMALTRSQG